MKLIFLDIDGTLTLPGESTPPESAIFAVRAAREKGNKVFLSTGRNPSMLAPLLRFGFDGIISCAGGYVVCGDEVIYDCPMAEEQRDTALRALHESGVFCTIEARDATYGDENLKDFLGDASGGNSEIMRWRKALAEGMGIRPMGEYDGRPIYKVVFMCREGWQLARAKELLEKDFAFCYQSIAAHGCLNGELINRAFDKGRGVKRICAHLNVPIEDTVAFGDSMNDLEMIETAGIGICMENGSEELKAHSDRICPPVQEDGLLKAFRELKLI